MDFSSHGPTHKTDLQTIIRALQGARREKVSRPGVWFELGSGSLKAEPLVAYHRYSADELVFKEYNDEGAITLHGHVWYTRDGSRVNYKLEVKNGEERTIEGWLALDFPGEGIVDVYTPVRLVETDQNKGLVIKVLKGYCNLKRADLRSSKVETGQMFATVQKGLSGEVEAKHRFRMVEEGLLKE
jgi:hypothetical protein